MILQSMELNPNPKTTHDSQHMTAAERMRYQLYLIDRSQHRKSIGELMAAMLDKTATDLPV